MPIGKVLGVTALAAATLVATFPVAATAHDRYYGRDYARYDGRHHDRYDRHHRYERRHYRPKKIRVCRPEWRHHHRVKVCRTVWR
jgi:hypothetical protein